MLPPFTLFQEAVFARYEKLDLGSTVSSCSVCCTTPLVTEHAIWSEWNLVEK